MAVDVVGEQLKAAALREEHKFPWDLSDSTSHNKGKLAPDGVDRRKRASYE